MEEHSSLQFSQHPAAGRCLQADKPSPNHLILLLQDPFKIMLLPVIKFPGGLSYSNFPVHLCHMLSPPHPPWFDHPNGIWQGL